MSAIFKTQSGGGGGGLSASIFVKGLSESDVVTATKDGVTKEGKWTERDGWVDTKIPAMTSNTTPSGIATASTGEDGEHDGRYAAYYAFDGSLETVGWCPTSSDSFGNAYVQYEFETPIVPSRVDIATIISNPSHKMTYRVEASLDATEWDVLVNDLYVDTFDTYYENTINTEKTYKYFRLILVSGHGGAGITNTNGHKMQVYGTTEAKIGGHLISRIKDLGMWTVTATNGVKTRTVDVLVDVATEYEIFMDLYKLWLYREGDECEEVTGGWDGILTDSSRAMYQYSRNATDMSWSSSGGKAQQYYACTENEIDLTGFTKIEVDYDFYTDRRSNTNENWKMDIGFIEGASILIHDFNNGSVTISGVKTYSLPESVLNTKRKICFRNSFNWTTSVYGSCTIRGVRLVP